MFLYQIIAYFVNKKIPKSLTKTRNLKISSNMEWRIRISWWIIFCLRYSRLLQIYRNKHKIGTNNPSITIYVNKMKNKIKFKIRIGYYFELLTPETLKLLWSTRSEIIMNENSKNVPHLEITEVVLVYCNIVRNNYRHDWRAFYIFVPNKSFGELLDTSPKNFIFLKTFNSEFSCIEVWFTDQNFKLLEIEDKINITLVIN